MKKSHFFILFLLLASCMKEEPTPIITSEEPPTLTADEYRAFVALKPRHTIQYEDALQQAIEASTLFGGEAQTKATPKGIIDGLAITTNLTGLTKSDASGTDTLIYLFNYANDEGYVFISADERAPGILAYIEKGYFNIKDSIECPGTAMLFSGMEVLIKQEVERSEFLKDSLGAVATAKYEAITKNNILLAKGAVGPAGPVGDKDGPIGPPSYKTEYTKQNPNYGTIVQTNWEQEAPFNGLLPPVGGRIHASLGCHTVAVAQIIAHCNHPQSYASVPIYTCELRTLKNWRDFSTPALKSKIAVFNTFIFDNLNTGYDDTGTSSNYDKVKWFLKALGYYAPESLVHYNFTSIKTSIDVKALVYTQGYSHRTKVFLGYSYSGGHSWIIDHYTNITKTIYEVTQYSNKVVTKIPISSTTTMHIHCNMGYGESYNGYYIDGVFNINALPEANTKSETFGNFQYKVEIAPLISVL